jgi:hypothetical protein
VAGEDVLVQSEEEKTKEIQWPSSLPTHAKTSTSVRLTLAIGPSSSRGRDITVAHKRGR